MVHLSYILSMAFVLSFQQVFCMDDYVEVPVDKELARFDLHKLSKAALLDKITKATQKPQGKEAIGFESTLFYRVWTDFSDGGEKYTWGVGMERKEAIFNLLTDFNQMDYDCILRENYLFEPIHLPKISGGAWTSLLTVNSTVSNIVGVAHKAWGRELLDMFAKAKTNPECEEAIKLNKIMFRCEPDFPSRKRQLTSIVQYLTRVDMLREYSLLAPTNGTKKKIENIAKNGISFLPDAIVEREGETIFTGVVSIPYTFGGAATIEEIQKDLPDGYTIRKSAGLPSDGLSKRLLFSHLVMDESGFVSGIAS